MKEKHWGTREVSSGSLYILFHYWDARRNNSGRITIFSWIL